MDIRKHKLVTDLLVIKRTDNGKVMVTHVEIPTHLILDGIDTRIIDCINNKKVGVFDPYLAGYQEIINWGGLRKLDEETHAMHGSIHIVASTMCKTCAFEFEIGFATSFKVKGKNWLEEITNLDIAKIKKLSIERMLGPIEIVVILAMTKALVVCHLNQQFYKRVERKLDNILRSMRR
jgi:hypothetical protein